MNKKQIITITSILVGILIITAAILLTSPLTSQLLNSDSPSEIIRAIVGLAIFVLMIAGAAALSITFIIACCYLAKRLGYEMTSGLLLLIPIINLLVFFSWAFRESPNERKLQRAMKETS